MKLNFVEFFKERSGDYVKLGKGNATAGDLVLIALDNTKVALSPEEKLKRYRLMRKIEQSLEGKDVDFSLDELTIIKASIDQVQYTPYLYGQMVEWLEPREEKLKAV